MSVYLLLLCYLVLFGTAFVLFNSIYGLLHIWQTESPQNLEISESYQSIISGFWIIITALVLSIFFHVFILSAIWGIFIIFSGSRTLKKHLKSESGNRRFGTFIFSLFIFILSFLVVSGLFIKNFNSDERAENKNNGKQTKVEKVESSGYVLQRGFARKGPSSNHEILGICSTGTELKLIKKKDGFYYAKGKYRQGPEGKGDLATGKFWIGGGLLTKNKSKDTDKKNFWHSNKSENKSRKRNGVKPADRQKSWPSFD